MSAACRIDRVYVEAMEGQPFGVSHYKAWEGFRRRQLPTALVEPEELLGGRLPLAPDTLVVAGFRCMREVFRQLGVSAPVPDDLPECLAPYRGRRVWPSTLGQLRTASGPQGNGPLPVFFKPLNISKLFPGQVLRDAAGLLPLADLPDETVVLVSECVAFLSEWRCFVCRGRILGLSHYLGDFLLYPDAAVVRRAVDDYRSGAPAAYAIDFGVTADGRTLLVEVNHSYALGSFGLHPDPYSEMLEVWWLEQITPRVLGDCHADPGPMIPPATGT